MAILSNINGKFAVDSTGAIELSGDAGAANEVLVSGGAGAAPTWVVGSTVIGGPYVQISGDTMTGNLVIDGSNSLTVGGALTGLTSSFVSTVAGTTVVSSEGAYSSSASVKLYEAKRAGGAVASDWSYNESVSPLQMEIGTSTSHSFAIKTANTPRLTINNSGNSAFAGEVTMRVDQGANDNAVLRLRGQNTTNRITRLQFEDYSGTLADGLIQFRIPTVGTASSALLEIGVNSAGLTLDHSNNATFAGNATAPNFIASTAVYTTTIYSNATTWSVKNNTGADYLSFDASKNATFAGDVKIAEASNKGQLFFGTANTDYEIKGGGNYGYLSSNAPILRFDTGGTERMRINSTGNIDFKATGNAVYYFGQNRPDTNTLNINATADSVLQLMEAESVKVLLHSSGDSYLNGGNVGIGITVPTTSYQKVLHVHEPSGSANIHITNNTTGSASGDGCDLIAYGSDFYIWNREAGNMFLGTNATTRLTINSSGNATFTTTLNQGGITATSAQDNVIVGINNTGTNGQAWRIQSTGGSSGLGAGKLFLKVGGTETAANLISFDAPSGADIKMGIGTASPGYKLDVYQGDIVRTGFVSGGYMGITSLPGYTANAYQSLTSGGTIHFSNNGKYCAYIEGADTYFGILNSSSVTKISLNTNGNTYFNGGNVGIGLTAPTASLGIQANFSTNGSYTTDGWARYLVLDAANTGGGGIIWTKQSSTYNRAILNNQGKMEFGRSTANDASAAWISDLAIDASGNVGIGTTLPSAKLTINAGVAATTAGPTVRISKGASPVGLIDYDVLVIEADDVPTIRFGENDGTVSTIMSGDSNLRINSTSPIKFYTAGTATGVGHGGQGGTFAMIINNSQNVGIKETSPSASLHLGPGGTSQVGIKVQGNSSSTVENILSYNSQAHGTGWYHLVGQYYSGGYANAIIIYGNGNVQNLNNSYGQISDEKLKENITDATPKLEDIKKLKVKNFNFKGDDLKQIGMIAQEVEEVFPGLVEEVTDPKTKEKSKSLKYSVFVPMLIKSIQELEARVKELENK